MTAASCLQPFLHKCTAFLILLCHYTVMCTCGTVPSGTTPACPHCLAEYPMDSVMGWLYPAVSAQRPTIPFRSIRTRFSFRELLPLRMVLLHGDLIESKMPNCNLELSFFSSGKCW